MKTFLTLFKEKVKDTDSQLEIVNLSRTIRQNLDNQPNTLIRDIRLLFNYTTPKSLLYLNRYCDIVLNLLKAKNFLCPDYHHLYIRVAEREIDALKNIVFTETWNTYGIAQLNKDTLLNANQDKQQLLFLNAIYEGLLDIAALDKLDKIKIEESIEQARIIGILGETIFKTKENKKIKFSISTKGILEQYKEEIYFAITDKEKDITAKWKYGKESIFIIRDWFATINLTNKIITLKPKANMDLVQIGGQNIIEIDVEKELADPTKITPNSS